MFIRARANALVALLLAALPALAQPAAEAPAAQAADLRAEVEALAWLGALDLTPAEAKTWVAALDGVPALLANIDAQENAPEVIAALQALRAKALSGQPITEEDWSTVEEARCRVVAARLLDEPEVRRQQALLPLATRLSAELTRPQQLVLADYEVLEMSNRFIALIMAGQREASDGWREEVKQMLDWMREHYEAKGEEVAKKVGELIEAGRVIKPEQWAKEHRGLRDELITALGVDHEPQELAQEAAVGLAQAIVERPKLPAMLRLWAARTP